MTKTKVIDLKELYNFIVDNFFIWNHLSKENYVLIFHIVNSIFSNDLGWRNDQNQSCKSRRYLQLCSLKCFYLDSFSIPNTHFKIPKREYEENEYALWTWPSFGCGDLRSYTQGHRSAVRILASAQHVLFHMTFFYYFWPDLWYFKWFLRNDL
jgi:hypothetical protein